MAEIRLTRVEQGQTKIRNVPIAVTPEGFWCCPSPIVFQKTLKTQNSINKTKSSTLPTKNSVHKRETIQNTEKQLMSTLLSDDQKVISDGPAPGHGLGLKGSIVTERIPRPKVESLPRKVAIEFGEMGTSDLKVVLIGKHGFTVKLSVHKSVLMANSSFFSAKLAEQESCLSCVEIDDCDDVEIYVETVGLMYCKEMKLRLIRQSVSRVLRILKIAELLGFNSCMQSCLEFLEAVPWVGEEEEEKVVSSVQHLQGENIKATPVLKRVSSDHLSSPPKDILSHIIDLVLKSKEERGRREMKSIVLRLLRENNSSNINNNNSSNIPTNQSPTDICNETLYRSCNSCLDSLLSLFKQASDSEFDDNKGGVAKMIALEADNLTWLLEILADRQVADEFAIMWANQQELASLHTKLPIVSRHHISGITARLYVGIGRGELLPSKDTRLSLLQTWLQPLMDDYTWLLHGSRSFDRKVVEEGIGRTILTLPLEDQQSILLSWLGCFLKAGDNCPNLQRAFEVWWRRTFVRPYCEPQGNTTLFKLIDDTKAVED